MGKSNNLLKQNATRWDGDRHIDCHTGGNQTEVQQGTHVVCAKVGSVG